MLMLFKKPFSRTAKRFIVTFLSLTVIAAISLLASLYLLHHQTQSHVLAQWLKVNTVWLLVWRLGILIAIFLFWPPLVRYRLRGKTMSEATLKRAIHQRYVIILSLLAIDIFLHLF
ncbi:MAG: hypothetical protein K0R12_1187 [Gammaproteobacteria bacterium]|jgi:Kef-type K+ transport system membrane component KefB|nr:hypothetical protein [Gammaproteobacteria bacterium]